MISGQPLRFPRGWLATLVGGVLGAGLVGIIGMAAGWAWADAYGTGGFEDLIYPAIGTCIGAWFGSALGAAVLLKLRHHQRPLMSGFVFAVVGVMLIVALFAFGSNLLPQAFNETIGVAVIIVVPPVGAALIARRILED
jgi:hypothetical protein